MNALCTTVVTGVQIIAEDSSHCSGIDVVAACRDLECLDRGPVHCFGSEYSGHSSCNIIWFDALI